jgi:hypothetical protein
MSYKRSTCLTEVFELRLSPCDKGGKTLCEFFHRGNVGTFGCAFLRDPQMVSELISAKCHCHCCALQSIATYSAFDVYTICVVYV